MRHAARALLAAFLLCGANTHAQMRIHIPEVDKQDRICFALYTVHDGVLKMTAQFYPLDEEDDRTAVLQIRDGAAWRTAARSVISDDPYGNTYGDRTWLAHFRVETWDATRDWPYRVVALDGAATFEGLIRKDPVDKDEIVVAAFTGNSIYRQHGGDIPRDDIVDNIRKINPDLLFFSGDQVYEHHQHLGYWLKFGRDFGAILRDRPAITIPDDHDVGQPNLWGESGKKSELPGAQDGGYRMPVQYVKAVETAQTWHLPDPYDPTPIQRGIGVYYTDLTLGRVGFAIIEDRKFKTGPAGRVPRQGPRPDHIRDPKYDPRSVDIEGAVLLGERQLEFLHAWGQDWTGADMKAVLSQTIFCGGAHIHGRHNGRLHADMDSNGWPQTGRNKALAEIRRCFAVHIAGDQHLGTIFHHGIEDWEDACYSFCVPSIANLYLRWWAPEKPGANRQPDMPAYTGRHFDGFHNRVTCWAAANPESRPNGGKALTTRAAGFGVVRFKKSAREITFECWPRKKDVTDPDTRQYAGWPKTVKQADNYGRKAAAWLPALSVVGQENPVVQIIDESNGEVVYTLRILGTSYRPKVFQQGAYTIKVGEGKTVKTLRGIAALPQQAAQPIQIDLR